MKLNYTTSDAGRADAGFRERMDRAVRSLALSTGMTYAEAHRICAEGGRRFRRVMRPASVHTVYAPYELTPWMSYLDLKVAKRPTIDRLVRELPTGRYIVKVKGHVFAVIDGVCMDIFPDVRPRLRVEGYWTMKANATLETHCESRSNEPRQLELL
jgi:hypothetical protein